VSLLQAPGDLSTTPLAAILLEALNTRATGILSVAHGEGQSRVFIGEGRPVGAQVAAGFRPLGHVLLQAGVIDIEALSRSLAVMATTRRPQGQILVELGAVKQEVVDRYLAEQQAGYVTLIASLESGAMGFQPCAVPDWTRTSQLPTLRIIVEAMVRPQASALVASALHPVAGGLVSLSPGYAEVDGQFRWTPDEKALVERLERPTPLDVFFAPGVLPPERTRAIISALLLLGLAGVPDEQSEQSEGVEGLLEEIETPAAAPAAPPPAAAASPPQAAAARRSDPAEARARRQRLLQRAMQNMGVGPFAGRPQPTEGTPAPTVAATPAPAPKAPAPPAGSPEERLRKALLDVAPRARDKNLFVRLGLDQSAGRDTVKKAYLDLAKQFHPDRYAAPALEDVRDTVRDFFTAVNEAYETLSDDGKRADYIASLRGGAGAASPATTAAAANAQVDFEKGEACVRTRDFAKARAFLEAAVRANPIAKFQAALAWAYVADPTVKDRGRAREMLAEATKDPACDRAFFIAGVVERDAGNDAAAEKHFDACIKANPRHAEAVRELRAIELRRRKR